MAAASTWYTIRWGNRLSKKASTLCGRADCIALFGQSSGPVAPFDPSILNVKGSLFLTRPSLAHYAATRDELMWRAGDVLDWIAAGKLKLRIDRAYPLAEAAAAHRDLEGRRTAGKLLLTVQAE